MNKPNPGDRVTVTDSFDETWNGVVVDLLSTQFTYEVEVGLIKFAFYNDQWSSDET